MAHQGLLLGRSALQMRDFQVLEGSSERLQLHAGQVYSVVREVVVRQATKMSTGSSKALGCRTGPLEYPTPGGISKAPVGHPRSFIF